MKYGVNMKKIKFACPLDCFDLCSLVAIKENNKVIKIEGDKDHPITKGFVCNKGKDHLTRLYHPKRFTKPMLKKNNEWVEISYDDAIEITKNKLNEYLTDYGVSSILHYNDSGYGGISKMVDEIFFDSLGGVTTPTGTLCWGAGDKATEYDFGSNLSNYPNQIENSKLIILWSRNVVDTNIHMVSFINKAKKNGAKVVLIDPVKTESAKLADLYIQIKPGTDAALALGIGNYLIEKNYCDNNFIDNYTLGFENYKKNTEKFNISKVSRVTAIPENEIIKLAEMLGLKKPVSIVVGFGVQRYKNGGNTVRSINALGALTGNIGIEGGGLFYNNKQFKGLNGALSKKINEKVINRRTFSKSKFAEFVLKEKDIPIKCVFITKSNPLVQLPNINKVIDAFDSVEFKIGIDLFITDTMEHCDLIFPATTVLEEEDIISSGMFNPHILYSHQAVKPIDNIISEYELFQRIAKEMNIENYPYLTREEYFNEQLKPLFEKYNLNLNMLKENSFYIPNSEIAWKNREFNTPSKKFEFYSKKAEKDGQLPVADYIETDKSHKYALRFLTVHYKNSLHSQGFVDENELTEVKLSENNMKKYNFSDGEVITLESEFGKINAIAITDKNMMDGVALMYEGNWNKNGSVNFLTPDIISDMGEQTAYYDCFINVLKKDR